MAVPKVWKWNKKRYELAELIAAGKTYKQAAIIVGLSEGTVHNYMWGVPEFRAYVDQLTLENDLLTRAGMSRLLLNVIEQKFEEVSEDKDTVLAYLKFLNELKENDTESVTELKVTFK